MNKSYLFTSERLGFRSWLDADMEAMGAINADPAVMEFFPGIQSQQQTIAFIERMQKQLAEKGFCYFAVDRLDRDEFIGFTGLSVQTFEADFTPCVDIGWRLKKTAWHNGFATEGARRCLDYGFDQPGLQKIMAMAPKINLRSEAVMIRTGMRKVKEFRHPLLIDNERLAHCVLYERTV